MNKYFGGKVANGISFTPFMFQEGFISSGRDWYVTHNVMIVVVLLFYVHDKHLRSCWDGQLT